MIEDGYRTAIAHLEEHHAKLKKSIVRLSAKWFALWCALVLTASAGVGAGAATVYYQRLPKPCVDSVVSIAIGERVECPEGATMKVSEQWSTTIFCSCSEPESGHSP